MNEKGDFNELLGAIRARPAMYLGEPSLLRLWLFLEGYRCGLNSATRQSHAMWNIKFLIYVSQRTDGKPVGCRGYHTMITPHIGGDEAEALEFFWQLLDEFRAQEISGETK